MSYLSRSDIEKIADQIFRDYKRLPCLEGQQVDHVDPEILAHELCGLHIDHFHLSKDGLTLGMTAFKEMGVEVYDKSGQPCFYYLDGKTLLIEKDLKDDPAQYGRYHFTTAHEVAHQVLARLYPSDKVLQNRVIYYRGYAPQHPIQDWDEWQADIGSGTGRIPPSTRNAKQERNIPSYLWMQVTPGPNWNRCTKAFHPDLRSRKLRRTIF